MTPNSCQETVFFTKKERRQIKLKKKKPTIQDKVNLKNSQKLIFKNELNIKLSLVVSCDVTTEINVVVHVTQELIIDTSCGSAKISDELAF